MAAILSRPQCVKPMEMLLEINSLAPGICDGNFKSESFEHILQFLSWRTLLVKLLSVSDIKHL